MAEKSIKELITELRQRTSVGLMECKKYLTRCDNDIEKAIELMRTEGVAKAAKKAGRIAAEGCVLAVVSDDAKKGVIIEVNCETDFVSRGDDFINFVRSLANQALANGSNDVAELAALPFEGSDNTIETTRAELVSKIGENIQIRRVQCFETDGTVGAYNHGSRIGVLVDINGGSAPLAKDLCMHIAASNPAVVEPSQVPAEMVEKEREIYSAQAQESGKPAEIIEKMIDGRMKKYLDEVSLHGQAFVKDPNTKVAALLNQANASVSRFVRYEVGEGIEKKQENFVEEVMAQLRED